jgi:hypothetical protein
MPSLAARPNVAGRPFLPLVLRNRRMPADRAASDAPQFPARGKSIRSEVILLVSLKTFGGGAREHLVQDSAAAKDL